MTNYVIRAAKRKPLPVADVPCGGCTLCCRGQRVFLVDGIDNPDEFMVVRDRNAITLTEHWRLADKPNGDCIYLDDAAGCTIHGRAPSVCRGFDCRSHYHLPSSERRRREAMFGRHDLEICARGRQLVESGE